MHMGHVLVEIFCEGEQATGKQTGSNATMLGCNGSYEIGVGCWECPFASFTSAPNELALSDSFGAVAIAHNSFGFGGHMFPAENEAYWRDRWQSIAREKLNGAYQEYMNAFRANGKSLFD